MRVRDIMERKLTEVLTPRRLSIIDESDQHRGHTGADPRGESHFRLVVVSACFRGLSRVARQQMVYGLLDAELRERIHALSMRTLTPEEEEDDPTLGTEASLDTHMR